MDYTKLGSRIREYRTKSNIKQEELAEAVGLSAVFISQIENAQRKPSLETVFAICQYLNISVDALVVDSVVECTNSDIDALVAVLRSRTDIEVNFIVKVVKEMLSNLHNGSVINSGK
jgi:transcriptional regulator with XRE-family HTH domain